MAAIPPAFIPVVGPLNVIAPGVTEPETLVQILHWIGFRVPADRQSLIDDCFSSFENLSMLTNKDITAMASDFGSRTAANGRIIFGTIRTKLIRALIHWIGDFYRISLTPTIVGLSETTFKDALRVAESRYNIRKSLSESASIASKAADPGPLKNEKMWKEWEEKFLNYLRCLLGANGVPLVYVIRENDDPDHVTNHPDFVARTIACAPLTGEFFDADKLSVFNLIVSFTTGHPSGDWIKSTLNQLNGRVSMRALRTHFAGAGNATRNIAEADRLKESLHYKGERAMAFETFLTQMQKMFNIYEKEGEAVNEAEKVRLLFKKVQHDKLSDAISALQAQQTLGTVLTYSQCANHLSARVSELPEYILKNRNIASVSQGGDGKGGDNEGIYNADGSIRTGHISNWKTLSNDERNIVKQERLKKKGTAGGNANKNKTFKNTMKQLKNQNKVYKRQIKALKKVTVDDDKVQDGDGESVSSDDDAGDQFGGQNAKRKSKKKSKKSS